MPASAVKCLGMSHKRLVRSSWREWGRASGEDRRQRARGTETWNEESKERALAGVPCSPQHKEARGSAEAWISMGE